MIEEVMMNIPQEYKQTEFGAIPNDWVLCTFNDVLATFSSGATPYRGIPEYYSGNIRWISSGELNSNVINDTIEHISENAVRNTHLRIHKPGTFLMAITGLEAEGTRGKCAFVGAPSATNQSCLAINGTDKMCVEYLFWFYRMWGQYLAFKYCQGTKQQSYTAELVKRLPIYCPPTIEEQQKIAEALSDVDELIAALDKKIAKKKLIKQAAMQQLLTGKKRLQGFSGEWNYKFIIDICEILDNKRIPLNEKQRVAGKYPYCGANGIVDFIDQYIFDEELILIAEDGGNFEQFENRPIAYIMNGKYWVNNHAHILKAKQHYSQSFIFHQLEHKDITEHIVGGTRSKLTRSHLEQISFYIPNSYMEQQAIAKILSDMDEEIMDLERKRDKHQLLKNGMMQKLLTGQIRIK